MWKETLRDNLLLIGYHVYSGLFPSLLEHRIKLNSASHHCRDLDRATAEGRKKSEQCRETLSRLKRVGSAHSALHGRSYSVDNLKSKLDLMSINFEDDDERQRFFLQREFSITSGKREKPGSSGVYQSCCSAIGLMCFSIVILGRPTSFESVV